jgi:hypothetical protein
MTLRYVSALLLAYVALAQDARVERARQWGEQSGPYRLSILSDKDEYLSGEPMKITVTTRNVSDGPVYVPMGTPLFVYKIAVRAPAPEWSHWSLEIAPIPEAMNRALAVGSHSGRPLGPAEEVSQYIEDLTRFYDMTKPGGYRVTFSRLATPRPGASSPVQVVSNEVTITVLSKRP